MTSLAALDVRTAQCEQCGVRVFTTDNGCTLEREQDDDTASLPMSVQVLPGLLIATSPLPGSPTYTLHEHQAEPS